MITTGQLRQWVGGEYLTERLPDNWDSMSEADQLDFIEDHKWQPLEHHEPQEIDSMIECSVDDLVGFLRGHGIQVND